MPSNVMSWLAPPSMPMTRQSMCWRLALARPGPEGPRSINGMSMIGAARALRRPGIASPRIAKARGPRQHFKGLEGWLHAGGYAAFEDLYRGGRLGEVACLRMSDANSLISISSRDRQLPESRSSASPNSTKSLRRRSSTRSIPRLGLRTF